VSIRRTFVQRPELALVALAQAGDERAFAQLAEPHRPALLRHCYRMLGSLLDAEDAVQDAFVHAWRGLPRFEPRAPFQAWLYRIATNVCLTALRRRPPHLEAKAASPVFRTWGSLGFVRCGGLAAGGRGGSLLVCETRCEVRCGVGGEAAGGVAGGGRFLLAAEDL